MRKITFSFKSLLLAAGLLLGSANAWGETNVFSQDFTTVGESTDPSDYGFTGSGTGTIATVTVADGKFQSEVKNGNTNYIASFTAVESGNIVTFTCNWMPGNATTGQSMIALTDADGNYILKIQKGSGGNYKYKVNDTEVASTNKNDGSNVYAVSATINMTSKKITALSIGTLYTASADISFDATSISKLRVYNQTTATSWSNTTTIDDVVITKSEIYSYTVNARIKNSTTVLKTLVSTSYVVQGDAVTVGYPEYINNNGTLYSTDATSKEYKKTFTPDADAYVYNIDYTITDKTNVVFFAEGEDIAGATTESNKGCGNRTSNSSTGVFDDYTDFVTLPAGTYTITLSYYNSSSTATNAYISNGTSDIFTPSCANLRNSYTSESIVLNETTTLKIKGGYSSSNNPKGIDLIYIQGTPTNDIIGALDFSTDYLGDMTDKVTLSPGDSYNYKFVNHNSNGSDNSKNWVLPIYVSGAAEPTIVLRSDNWEDKAWKNDGCQLVSKGTDDVWADFINQLNGATVDMTVNYTAERVVNVSCDITTSGGKEWTYTYNSNYTGSAISFAANIDIALAISKSWAEVLAQGKVVNETLNTNMEGYKTFYNATSNYKVDNNTTIYIAAAPDANSVKLTSVAGKVVPKGTPVILNSTAATIEITPTSEASSDDFSDNELQVADGTESNKYVLGYTTTDGFGFYYYTATLPANYIYLDGAAPSPGGVKALRIIVDGEATGIAAPEVAEKAEDGVLYNLNGQVVTEDYKGIVIKNGKKFFNK